jgi:hypothetical protein
MKEVTLGKHNLCNRKVNTEFTEKNRRNGNERTVLNKISVMLA